MEEKIKQNSLLQNNKKIIFISLALFFVISITSILYYVIVLIPQHKVAEKIKEHNLAYYSSLLENNPVAIQNLFIEDLKNGINDKYTKADAYFITHRYFDNGGNIYEVYNYVGSHPELAFLMEAEAIYPNVFVQIKNKKLPTTFTDRSNYAYLAYVEVLYKHGYTDVAAMGTIANQYAKMAFFNKAIAKEMSKNAGAYRSYYSKRDAVKAGEFIVLTKPVVDDILSGKITTNDVTPRDVLVGLNQYAAAIRYVEAYRFITLKNVSTSSIDHINEKSSAIFKFTTNLAYKDVPELRHFTALLNASTLAILPRSNPLEIREALYPIIDLDLKKTKIIQNSIIHKILDSKHEPQPKNIGDSNLDIYSKRNTLRLASMVPGFKKWLIDNGWKEGDFSINK